MNRTITPLIAGCLLSVASLCAQAQAPGTQLKMDSGFYIGAGLGRSEVRDICHLGIGGACDAKDMSWNLFAGYQVNRHFAIEGGYSDFGEVKLTGFTVVGGVPSTITTETTVFELVGVGIVPLTDTFSLYGKFGVFRYESDGTSTGGAVGSANDKGTELTFGFGAQYEFVRQFAARVEWQRYYAVGSGLFGLPRTDMGIWRLGARYKF